MRLWGAPAALVSAGLLLGFASPAGADVRSYSLRFGPVTVDGFETVLPRGRARTPQVDGNIIAMHARIVDRRGSPVTVRDVMLHHIFFQRRRRATSTFECHGQSAEMFYGTGEEDQRLRLPKGYGYRIRANDRWHVAAMLMSHDVHRRSVYLQYRVTVDITSRLTPVTPFWLRANGCSNPGYFINGGEAPGSVHVQSLDWHVPYDLRIVAAGGHLHGGARDMWLSQPGCGDRRLLDNQPAYGMPDHLYYRARPILHEPGPVDTRYFMSRTGIAATRGETIRLTAVYDAEHPRTAMAVMHVYVARAAPPGDCEPLPAGRQELTKPGPTRSDPPWTPVPLTGLAPDGGTETITESPFTPTPLAGGARVEVGDGGFAPPHAVLSGPAKLTWVGTGSLVHNVRLAEGPRLVATPSLRRGTTWTTSFTTPGRYTLFCTRHPLTMHAYVDVTL